MPAQHAQHASPGKFSVWFMAAWVTVVRFSILQDVYSLLQSPGIGRRPLSRQPSSEMKSQHRSRGTVAFHHHNRSASAASFLSDCRAGGGALVGPPAATRTHLSRTQLSRTQPCAPPQRAAARSTRPGDQSVTAAATLPLCSSDGTETARAAAADGGLTQRLRRAADESRPANC